MIYTTIAVVLGIQVGLLVLTTVSIFAHKKLFKEMSACKNDFIEALKNDHPQRP